MEDKVPKTTLFLESVNADQMRAILTFIYAGKIDTGLVTMEGFFDAARKLEIRDVDNMDANNSTEIEEENNNVMSNSNDKFDVKRDKDYDEDETDFEQVNEAESSINEGGESAFEDVDDGESEVEDFSSSQQFIKVEEVQDEIMLPYGVNVNEETEKFEKFKCELCPFKSKNKRYIKMHFQRRHGSEKIHCRECSFVAKVKFDLQQHVKRMHSNRFEEVNVEPEAISAQDPELKWVKSDGGLFKCAICDYQSNMKRNAEVHFQRKHGAAVYSCHDCHYSCKAQIDLKNHIRRVHDKNGNTLKKENAARRKSDAKMIKCDKCDFETHSKAYAYRHYRRKHGEDMFCEECPYTTKAPEDLKQHVRGVHKRVKSSA